MWTELLRFKKYNREKCLAFAEEYEIPLTKLEKFWVWLNPGRAIELPFMDIDVTSWCNLRCEKCAKMIPQYSKENRKHYPAGEIIVHLHQLLRYMDRIWVVSIIGGEPLLHPELDKIIRFCSDCLQFKSVNVTTSGTVMPGEKVLEALRGSRVKVKLSDYDGALEPRYLRTRDRFLEKLREYEIPFYFTPHTQWLDFGPIEWRNYPDTIRRKTLSDCYINGCSVFNQGILYRCGRASYMANHGMPMSEGQTIVAAEINGRTDLRKKIFQYYSAVYMDACDYCTIYPPEIQAGIQEQRSEKNVHV